MESVTAHKSEANPPGRAVRREIIDAIPAGNDEKLAKLFEKESWPATVAAAETDAQLLRSAHHPDTAKFSPITGEQLLADNSVMERISSEQEKLKWHKRVSAKLGRAATWARNQLGIASPESMTEKTIEMPAMHIPAVQNLGRHAVNPDNKKQVNAADLIARINSEQSVKTFFARAHRFDNAGARITELRAKVNPSRMVSGKPNEGGVLPERRPRLHGGGIGKIAKNHIGK